MFTQTLLKFLIEKTKDGKHPILRNRGMVIASIKEIIRNDYYGNDFELTLSVDENSFIKTTWTNGKPYTGKKIVLKPEK